MTHSDAKYKTKKKLSERLKVLLEQKPLSKITVSELTADCELNRKTFYYHFKDITELLRWTLEQEAMITVREYGEINNYNEAIIFALDYIESNRKLLSCAYNSIGNDAVRYFCNKDFKKILLAAIIRDENKLGVKLSETFREFLTTFFTETLTGIIADIFEKNEPCDINRLSRYLTLTLKASIPSSIIAASESEM